MILLNTLMSIIDPVWDPILDSNRPNQNSISPDKVPHHSLESQFFYPAFQETRRDDIKISKMDNFKQCKAEVMLINSHFIY